MFRGLPYCLVVFTAILLASPQLLGASQLAPRATISRLDKPEISKSEVAREAAKSRDSFQQQLQGPNRFKKIAKQQAHHAGLTTLYGSGKAWWQSWKDAGSPKPFDWMNQCQGVSSELDSNGAVLNCWLSQHPQIAQSLVWENVHPHTGAVTPLSYFQWSPALKAQLYKAFHKAYQRLENYQPSSEKNDRPMLSADEAVPARSQEDSVVSFSIFHAELDPPHNQLALSDWNRPCTHIRDDLARNLYINTIAQSLALEIGGFVPWSVLGYGQTDRDVLFHSKNMFKAGEHICSTHEDEAKTQGVIYKFIGYQPSGSLIPADPNYTFDFLVEKNIIRPSHFASITQLLEWSRDNLNHYLGGFTTNHADKFWHYRGAIPARRVMAGTQAKNAEYAQLQGVKHWTGGCWGTTRFYRAVMRAINIPVQEFRESCKGHVLPVFWTIGHGLSHGDDPYSAFVHTSPPFPAHELLIPNNVFAFWFVNSEAECGNVGRRAVDLAIQYLPDFLVNNYCTDLENGTSHANGKVYEHFASKYSVEYLESQQLWKRLGQKAAKTGKCGVIQASPAILKKLSK